MVGRVMFRGKGTSATGFMLGFCCGKKVGLYPFDDRRGVQSRQTSSRGQEKGKEEEMEKEPEREGKGEKPVD